MSQWPIKPLEEVCVINPRLPRNHGLADDIAVSFVPMAAIDERAGVIGAHQSRPYSEVKKGYTHFVDGDVLFAKITPCMENGKAAIARELVGGNGFGSTEFHTLRGNGAVLPEWLFYFVRREAFRAEAKRNFTGTAGQQRVPAAFLARSLIPTPPLPEQRRIVDLLARAEGIVRLRREAEKKAAELIPALFLDMFGDPATNPKGWRLGTVADVLSEPPVLGTMAKPSSTSGQWLDLRVANIQGGQLLLDDRKWVELPDDQIGRFSLRQGDVLLARAIGSLDHLGKAVVVYPEGDWAFDSHLMRLRFDTAKLLPEVFKGFLESVSGRDEFLRHTRRSAVQFNINGKEIRQVVLPIPPLDCQREYLKRVANVIVVKSQQSAATAKAQETFAALLASVFSEAAH